MPNVMAERTPMGFFEFEQFLVRHVYAYWYTGILSRHSSRTFISYRSTGGMTGLEEKVGLRTDAFAILITSYLFSIQRHVESTSPVVTLKLILGCLPFNFFRYDHDAL